MRAITRYSVWEEMPQFEGSLSFLDQILSMKYFLLDTQGKQTITSDYLSVTDKLTHLFNYNYYRSFLSAESFLL